MEGKIIKVMMGIFLILEGIIFTFGLPPFQKFDEVYHFGQALKIGHGCYLNNNYQIPVGFDKLVTDYRFEKVLLENEKYPISLNNFRRVWTEEESQNKDVAGKCGIGQIGHIPNGLGIWVTRWTNNPTVIFFAGRMMSFIFFGLILWWSLKIIDKKFGYLLWFYSLMPMVVHQVTAYNYDVVLSSLIMPVTALLINKIIGKKIKTINEILPYVLVLIIGILKITYLPLIGLFVLIDWPKNIKRNALLLGIMTLVIGSQYGLLKFITPKSDDAAVASESSGYATFVNPTLQRQLILKDPIYFVDVLKNTFVETWEPELKEMVGVFGWRNVPLKSDWVVWVYLVAGLYLLIRLSKDLDKKVSITKTILSLGILKLIVVVVCVVMYLVWSVVALRTVHGIQGRYWVPLVPFIFIYEALLISQVRNSKIVRIILIGLILVSVVIIIFNSLWSRYYDLSDTIKTLEFNESNATLVVDKKIELTKEVGGKNVFGFMMNLNSGDKPVLVPYKYRVMDRECKKTLRYGYLNPWTVQGETRLEQKFDVISTKEDRLCLTLEPLDVQMADYNVYLNIKTENGNSQWGWMSYEN